jgi:hypothetical protein
VRTGRTVTCALTLAFAFGALACQAGSPTSVGDAAVEQPSFEVPPLDGATAGYALSFDGVRQYATAGDAYFAPVGGPMTIELWVNYAAAANTQDFLALRTSLDNGTKSGVQIGLHAGTLAVWRVYVDYVLVQAPTTPAAGTWHHVAYTFDATTNVLYVDGTAVATSTLPTDSHTPTSAWLGTYDGYANMFKGALDEIRVWKAVRSASEIVSDMQHSSGQGDADLVAYWTFDDATNVGRSADLSGHGNDVTLGDGVAALMPLRVPSEIPF